MRASRLKEFLEKGDVPAMTSLDESLSEHDKRYHDGHYDESKGSCGKRESLASGDKDDEILVKSQRDAAVESVAKEIKKKFAFSDSDEQYIRNMLLGSEGDAEFYLLQDIRKMASPNSELAEIAFAIHPGLKKLFDEYDSVQSKLSRNFGVERFLLMKDVGKYRDDYKIVIQPEKFTDKSSVERLVNAGRSAGIQDLEIEAFEYGYKSGIKGYNVVKNIAASSLPKANPNAILEYDGAGSLSARQKPAGNAPTNRFDNKIIKTVCDEIGRRINRRISAKDVSLNKGKSGGELSISFPTPLNKSDEMEIRFCLSYHTRCGLVGRDGKLLDESSVKVSQDRKTVTASVSDENYTPLPKGYENALADLSVDLEEGDETIADVVRDIEYARASAYESESEGADRSYSEHYNEFADGLERFLEWCRENRKK